VHSMAFIEHLERICILPRMKVLFSYFQRTLGLFLICLVHTFSGTRPSWGYEHPLR
jgi:hypothetical protein